MEIVKPILWYQGLFLQPQHFQRLEQYYQASLTSLIKRHEAHYWGICQLEIQTAELQNEMLEVVRGEFIFQDGTWVISPGNAQIYSRSFSKKNYKEGRPSRFTSVWPNGNRRVIT